MFTIDFKSPYTNISVKDAINSWKHFFQTSKRDSKHSSYLQLIDLVLKCAIMTFQETIFMQVLGTVMSTNLAPIFGKYIRGNVGRRIIY